MPNYDVMSQLVRVDVGTRPIASLAPTQDTIVDQLAFFYQSIGIPFTRHSPLPTAANATINAAINSVTSKT